jgi:hypothetical protein
MEMSIMEKPKANKSSAFFTKDNLMMAGGRLSIGCFRIIVIVFFGIVSWRIAWSNWNMDLSKFDFSDLLALILGLFAMAMSVAFYFKATDTSNKFYDNVYKFTQETSEILGRIEAGFGERLRHLDEAYHGMRDTVDKLPSKMQVSVVKEELAEEKQSMDKLIVERDKIINNLVSKSKLNDEEKDQIKSQLKEKDSALASAHKEIAILSQQLRNEHMRRRQNITEAGLDSAMTHFLIEAIKNAGVNRIGLSSTLVISQRFKTSILPELPRVIVFKMQKMGLISQTGELSHEGIVLLRSLARRELTQRNLQEKELDFDGEQENP